MITNGWWSTFYSQIEIRSFSGILRFGGEDNNNVAYLVLNFMFTTITGSYGKMKALYVRPDLKIGFL